MKLLKQLALVVVFFTVIVGVRSFTSQRASEKTAEQAMAMIQALPGYQEHQIFYDAAFENCHDIAFSLHHKQRRISSSFNERGYKLFLFKEIMAKAKAAENAQVFETMKQEILKIQPQFFEGKQPAE